MHEIEHLIRNHRGWDADALKRKVHSLKADSNFRVPRTDCIQNRCDMYRLPTEADCDAFAALMICIRKLEPHDGGEVSAHISAGRWAADCTECNSGMACSPGRDYTACIDCGALYSIRFPTDGNKVEAILLKRRLDNQNWHPGETIGDLESENTIRGVNNPLAL